MRLKTVSKRSYWKKIRKFFNDLHLWFGLTSGLILLVVCLTGTIYVYNTEIRELGARGLYFINVPESAKRLTSNDLHSKVRTQLGGTPTSMTIYNDKGRSVQFNLRRDGDKSRFGTTYFVDPYSGQILGDSDTPNKAAEWMGYLFSLHRWLLLDKIEKPIIGELPNRTLGSYITGTATILFTLGVITGLIIWFPRKLKNWRMGLKINWRGNWKRVNHDLHNTLAFYSFLILFLMGITGPFWSFPWYRTGLQKALGTYQEQNEGGRRRPAQEAGNPGGEGEKKENHDVNSIDLEACLAITDQHLSYPGNYRIALPQNKTGEVSVSKTKVGFFAPAAPDRIVIDPVAMEVKNIDIFRKKPFNQRVSQSVKSLHTGDVYGAFTKLIYFISCLIATSLPVTGTLIWINKLKRKSRKKMRKLHNARVLDMNYSEETSDFVAREP